MRLHKIKYNVNNRHFLAYLLALVLLFFVFVFFDSPKWELLYGIGYINIVVSTGLALLVQFISGIQYYFIRRQFGVSLKIYDIILLPPVIGLWSFIFPIKGSTLFSTIFFKAKYNMRISDSFAISIYLYLLTLCFTGFFGFVVAIANNQIISWLSFVSLVLFFNPVILIFVKFLSTNRIIFNNTTTIKFLNFLKSTNDSTVNLMNNAGFTIAMFSLKLIHLSAHILWYYYISLVFEFNLSFLEVALISLVAHSALIIKFTPGNLGTSQLLTGGFMGLIGASPDKAVLITLFASATVMLINFTIGLFGNIYYFRTMALVNLIKSYKDKY